MTSKGQQVGWEIYVCDTGVLKTWMARLSAISMVSFFSYIRRLYIQLASGRQCFRILDEPPLLHAQQPCDFQSNNTTTKRLDIMVPLLARSHSSFHH